MDLVELILSFPFFFLAEIVKSVSKLSQKCIMRFGEDKMYLICHDATEGGVQVWRSAPLSSVPPFLNSPSFGWLQLFLSLS